MTDCIEHTTKGINGGYGYKWYQGRNYRHHRLVYALAHGLDPATMGGVIMHTCDNRRCINPEHLVMGTQRLNMRDMRDKGRAPGNRLTDEQVAEIRRRYVPKCRVNGLRALAREFGVTHGPLSFIVNNITHKESK